MALLKLNRYQLHYGEQVIFDNVDFTLVPGDRLCITGRNGTGKSTLLKCVEGFVQPDSGERWVDPRVSIASLSQELPPADGTLVKDYVASGVADLVADIERYHLLACNMTDSALDEMEALHQQIEVKDGWTLENRIGQVLQRLDLDGEKPLQALSGGWRRRVDLAKALIAQPDVLLLDEPTNHLDIGAIQWLESFLVSFRGAVAFITHDRHFLRRVANKVAELDRGGLLTVEGTYDEFLALKEHKLAEEERHNALFDKRLAQEEVWIRQGIKARRTRNEGRVRALKEMRDERAQRRDRQKTASMTHANQTISGKIVAELENVSFAWEDKPIIKNFSGAVIRGDKIGLVGPNGVGKSTLLKLILGQITPTNGEVKTGTKISVAYFDQMREQLDLEKSALDNVSGGRDSIEINGKTKHIFSYLQDFLFSGERARTPIKSLSGGERNRILLAKLFSLPSNLLVLDEPTNDLDAETLELLEELLIDYKGTLLLVSHDRTFLDNVVSSTIAFEGQGRLVEYVGGYSDWIRQGGKWFDAKLDGEPVKSDTVKMQTAQADSSLQTKEPKKKKLSYKLQNELDKLPAQLESQEAAVEALNAKVAEPIFFQGEQSEIDAQLKKLAEAEAVLETLFARWEELEALSAP